MDFDIIWRAFLYRDDLYCRIMMWKEFDIISPPIFYMGDSDNIESWILIKSNGTIDEEEDMFVGAQVYWVIVVMIGIFMKKLCMYSNRIFYM